jgi:hypothetical protein
MTAPEPSVRPTRYTVNCVPEDDINASGFTITVEYRGPDTWAVCRHRQCLAADGTWDYEPRPSERGDGWLARYRHDLDTALKLARAAAPLVTVNGWTVADALAMRAATTEAERDAVWDAIRARLRAARAEGGDA